MSALQISAQQPHVNAQTPLLWLQHIDTMQKSSKMSISIDEMEAQAVKIGLPREQVCLSIYPDRERMKKKERKEKSEQERKRESSETL